jgi:fatty acid desaturase
MGAPEVLDQRASTTTRPTVHDIPVSLKSTLVDEAGMRYRDFRQRLRPRWARVWIELLAAYLVLAGALASLSVWDPAGVQAIAAAAFGALLIGYTIAYISNFLHEATHYNLVPGRKANDIVGNALMSWLFGTSVDLYRKVHFVHHRKLGTTMDSETSYFDPLRVRYLVEGLFGLKALRTIRRWGDVQETAEPSGSTVRRLSWLGVALVVNAAIVLPLAATGHWAAAAAWVAGELAVFPFFVSLRQTLEHRAEDAESEVDYRRVEHGAVNRLFGDGPVASTLGSAGFNRHALHHWEPQISYTRLKDLEAYLMQTELASQIQERQTSYHRTFLRLLEL